MKNNLFLIALSVLILSACGGNTEATTETNEALEQETDQSATENNMAFDISGLYTNDWHQQGWAVLVDERNGEWFAKGVELEAMLPPDNVFDYPEDIEFEYFTTFELDPQQMTFTSDWGKGRFEGGQMIFEEKEAPAFTDPEEEETSGLVLYKKKQSFTPAELVGFYRGSTWHSQGYVVIIEEQNGQLTVRASQTEGGEPTRADIEEYPEGYDFKTFNTFTLNENHTAFNSDWGKGRFQHDVGGMYLIFEKLIGAYDPGLDKEDIQVRLRKVEEEEM